MRGRERDRDRETDRETDRERDRQRNCIVMHGCMLMNKSLTGMNLETNKQKQKTRYLLLAFQTQHNAVGVFLHILLPSLPSPSSPFFVQKLKPNKMFLTLFLPTRRHKDGQADRQVDMKTDRQTDRQTTK